MNIQTVAENLRNTIAGKVKHEAELEYALTLATMGERIALTATLAYLQVNIGELKRILQDVEQCMSVEPIDPTTRVKDGQKFSPNYVAGHNAAISSWQGQVDRQGGSFDETDFNRDGWRN
jgi:hypothetical protein